MKITRSRLEEIIQEEANSVVKEDSYRTQYEVGVEDLEEDLAFFDDSSEEEEAEADEEAAETEAAPYVTGQGLQKEDVMKIVREELEAMMNEEGEKWIQGAEKDIEERGTEGVCTGDKFGGPTCRPGTKRYNLAKTFRKMAKKRKK